VKIKKTPRKPGFLHVGVLYETGALPLSYIGGEPFGF
jgi:hypothetical protein